MKRKSVRIYSFTGTGSCLALKLAEKLKQALPLLPVSPQSAPE